MNPSKRPVVIGGGAAGLAACLTLEKAGFSPLLLEGADRLGGRLRTDQLPDGTPVDVGFQVLLTAYPELQRWVDLEVLDSVAFVPGAMIHKGGRWRTLADPRRMPASIGATLFSGIGTWRDRIGILRLVQQSMRGTPESLLDAADEVSTSEFLAARGFSAAFVRDFLRPFFSGIFLDAALSPPAAQFLYTLRMMATGKVIIPVGGMAALVGALEGRLRTTEVRLGAEVQYVQEHALRLADGTEMKTGAIIDTVPRTEGIPWNACFNAVFHCEAPPFGQPIIGLLPEARHVTNLHFMEDVEPSGGKGKLNVTALLRDAQGVEAASMESAVREDLLQVGVDVGPLMWSVTIPRALPRMHSVCSSMRNPRIGSGMYVAGDHTAAPSLDAALRSGRVAAEALIVDSGRAKANG